MVSYKDDTVTVEDAFYKLILLYQLILKLQIVTTVFQAKYGSSSFQSSQLALIIFYLFLAYLKYLNNRIDINTKILLNCPRRLHVSSSFAVNAD